MSDKKFWIFLIVCFFVFGVVVTHFFWYEKTLESKCYTQLQPQNYFNSEYYNQDSYGNFVVSGKEGEKIIIDKHFYLKLTETTGSMRPAIPDEAKIILKNISSKSELKIGDIVEVDTSSYGYTDSMLHRIIKVENEFYITKGDNEEVSDPPIEFSKIKGKVVGVLY